MFFLIVCVVLIYLPSLGISNFNINLRVKMGSAFFCKFLVLSFFMFLSCLSWVILVTFFVTFWVRFWHHFGCLLGMFWDVQKKVPGGTPSTANSQGGRVYPFSRVEPPRRPKSMVSITAVDPRWRSGASRSSFFQGPFFRLFFGLFF